MPSCPLVIENRHLLIIVQCHKECCKRLCKKSLDCQDCEPDWILLIFLYDRIGPKEEAMFVHQVSLWSVQWCWRTRDKWVSELYIYAVLNTLMKEKSLSLVLIDFPKAKATEGRKTTVNCVLSLLFTHRRSGLLILYTHTAWPWFGWVVTSVAVGTKAKPLTSSLFHSAAPNTVAND